MSAAEVRELGQVLAEAEIRKSESKKTKTLVDLKDAKSGFDTPSLRYVGLTPPYFHDGSAPTLEALIENNHDRMGQTSHLTSEERRALVAYLRTL